MKLRIEPKGTKSSLNLHICLAELGVFWAYYSTLCCCKLIRAGEIGELVDEAIPAAHKCHMPGSLLILILFYFFIHLIP